MNTKMTKKNPPTPPASDDPIIVLRSHASEARIDLLEQLLELHDSKDVDGAARCALVLLGSSVAGEMGRSIAGLVNNLAHEQRNFSTAVTAVLRKAADLGHDEFAYNTANQIMGTAKTVDEYRDAEAYYKLAMSYSANPALQAAAHVNYCPIVRDGLITGVPDWPAAVEIYEAAGRMGLVKGMFNAGNVCSWIAGKGDASYGARAAQWFSAALGCRSSQKKTLDFESAEELAEIFDSCTVALSALHIDDLFEGANLEVGLQLAKSVAARGSAMAIQHVGVGHTRRLEELKAQPGASPGANWRTVLSQLDWGFCEEFQVIKARGPYGPEALDMLSVITSDGGRVPLFVMHDACLPMAGGSELILEVGASLVERGFCPFFLLPRKALHLQVGHLSHSPVYVGLDGTLSQQSLWMTCTPDLVLENARKKVTFPDARFGNSSCMIPIALNALDEGFVVARDAVFRQPYIEVGDGFCMAYVDTANLVQFGIDPRGLPDPLLEKADKWIANTSAPSIKKPAAPGARSKYKRGSNNPPLLDAESIAQVRSSLQMEEYEFVIDPAEMVRRITDRQSLEAKLEELRAGLPNEADSMEWQSIYSESSSGINPASEILVDMVAWGELEIEVWIEALGSWYEESTGKQFDPGILTEAQWEQVLDVPSSGSFEGLSSHPLAGKIPSFLEKARQFEHERQFWFLHQALAAMAPPTLLWAPVEVHGSDLDPRSRYEMWMFIEADTNNIDPADPWVYVFAATMVEIPQKGQCRLVGTATGKYIPMFRDDTFLGEAFFDVMDAHSAMLNDVWKVIIADFLPAQGIESIEELAEDLGLAVAPGIAVPMLYVAPEFRGKGVSFCLLEGCAELTTHSWMYSYLEETNLRGVEHFEDDDLFEKGFEVDGFHFAPMVLFVMQVEGTRPENVRVNPLLAGHLGKAPSPIALDSAVERRRVKLERHFERIRRAAEGSWHLVSYNPWDYPTT